MCTTADTKKLQHEHEGLQHSTFYKENQYDNNFIITRPKRTVRCL